MTALGLQQKKGSILAGMDSGKDASLFSLVIQTFCINPKTSLDV